MWSDKETTEDLLGYIVHASLIKNVVTNEKNLPITVGLYGDWGSRNGGTGTSWTECWFKITSKREIETV